MFIITKQEAPFLIGVKGRNISLIRKYSGLNIKVDDYMVRMSDVKSKNPNPELAWRMVVSACYGGILRWFETPYATKKGYPKERVEELQQCASKFGCGLELLRSRRGHMCLMLIPNIRIESMKDRPSDSDLTKVQQNVRNGRESILALLNQNV